MSSSWTRFRLSELAVIQGGGTPSRSNSSYFGGSIPWVTPSDLSSPGRIDVLGEVNETLTAEGLQNSSAKLLPPGSVLFSSRASIGKIAVTDRVCATNQGFINFTPLPDKVSPWFLAFMLGRYTDELTQLAAKTTFLEIPRGKVKDLEVAIPEMMEQHRLVRKVRECMQRVDEIDRLRGQALPEHEQLIESIVEDRLQFAEGDQVRLAATCSIRSRLVDPKEDQFQGLIHVGGGNIESKTGLLSNLRSAAEENLKSGKFLFDGSMVLYNKIRPYLKKVARPDFSGLCSADMYPLSPRSDVLTRDYLFYVLMSRRFTDYAIAGSNRAGMPKVNREHLFAYEFPLPALEMQKEITQSLDDAFAIGLQLKEEIEQRQVDTNALRQAILRQLFDGEM